MVQVSYPGVYIQEKSSGVKTITGVATSIGAFFGRAAKGYLNRAVRCLSYADFLRAFGGPHPQSDLAASVKQFFDNGGTDCYVVRLADSSARRARVELENLAGTAVLRATAKMEGVWGNGVRLEVDDNTPNPGETFNLTVIQEEGGQEVAREVFTNLSMDRASSRYAPSFVSQSSALIDLVLFDPTATPAFTPLGDPADPASTYNIGSFDGFSEARRPLGNSDLAVQTTFDSLINPGVGPRQHRFDISVDDSAYVTVNLSALTAIPATTNTIASALQTGINDALASLVPARQVQVEIQQSSPTDPFFLRITANSPGAENATVHIRRSAANDLAAALMLGADSGGVEMARRSNFRPAPTGTILRFDDGNGGLDRLNNLSFLNQDALTSITIGTEPAVSLNAAPNNLQTTNATDPFYRDARPGNSPSGHNDGVREKLQIMARAISNAPGSRYRAEVHGYQLVVLAKDGTVNEQPSSVQFAGSGAATINPAFQLNTRRYTLGTTGTSSFSSSGQDGDDGGAPASPTTSATRWPRPASTVSTAWICSISWSCLLIRPVATPSARSSGDRPASTASRAGPSS